MGEGEKTWKIKLSIILNSRMIGDQFQLIVFHHIKNVQEKNILCDFQLSLVFSTEVC